jgi:predicted PurR-regulated permease PerM
MPAPKNQIVLLKIEWLWNTALVLALGYVLFRIRATLIILALGYLIYLLLNPLANLIQKKIKNRALAVIAVFVTILVVVGLALNLILPSLIRDVTGLVKNSSAIQQSITQFADQKVLSNPIFQSALFQNSSFDLEKMFQQGLQWLSGQLLNFGTQILNASGLLVSGISQLLLGTIIALYFLLDGKTIRSGLESLLPTKQKKTILKITHIINISLMNYLRGMFVLSGIIFVLVWLILGFLKIPYAIAFAFWWGLMEFLPMIGSTLGILPPLLLTLLIAPEQFWWVLALLGILQFMEGNVLVPRIMNRSTGLHPLVIVLALLAGNNMAGIMGMIVAVPLVTIGYSIFKALRKTR